MKLSKFQAGIALFIVRAALYTTSSLFLAFCQFDSLKSIDGINVLIAKLIERNILPSNFKHINFLL